eukprot:scaffold247_cov274-Pinguiococcus_pyrenoidosus.AAC.2
MARCYWHLHGAARATRRHFWQGSLGSATAGDCAAAPARGGLGLRASLADDRIRPGCLLPREGPRPKVDTQRPPVALRVFSAPVRSDIHSGCWRRALHSKRPCTFQTSCGRAPALLRGDR